MPGRAGQEAGGRAPASAPGHPPPRSHRLHAGRGLACQAPRTLVSLECCETGTGGTVTFCLSGTGTGTIIKLRTLAEPDPYLITYGSGTVIKLSQYKIVYLISFIKIFSFTFYKKNW